MRSLKYYDKYNRQSIGKDAYHGQRNGKFQDRVRDSKTEPNGNHRTETYNKVLKKTVKKRD